MATWNKPRRLPWDEAPLPEHGAPPDPGSTPPPQTPLPGIISTPTQVQPAVITQTSIAPNSVNLDNTVVESPVPIYSRTLNSAQSSHIPNKPLLHLFPSAVMNVDGKRIDLPAITAGVLNTYLQSSGSEDFPIEVAATVQGIVEFFFESGSDGNGYWFDFRGDTGAISFGKYVAGASTTLASGTVPVSTTIARTLHIRLHANGKMEFQVRNTKITATDTTFPSLGANVGVGTFGGGPGYISHCTIHGHSGIHPDNQDTNFRAVIDFSQPDGGGAHQHVGKNRDNINDTNDLIRRPRLRADHLIDNGNFEYSATLPPPGWQAGHPSGNIGAATLSYDTTTQFAGNRSLRMVGAQFAGASQLKTIHVIPGEVYKLSAQLKANAGSAGVSLFVVDKTGAFLGQFPLLGSSSAVWTAVSGTGTIPANATLGYVLTSGQAAGTNDTEIDDVLLVRQRGYDDELVEQSTYSRILASGLTSHIVNTNGLVAGAVSDTAEDRETSAVTLSTASFVAVAKIASYTAFAKNDHIRFGIHSNLSITGMTLDNASSQKDSIQWEILVDQTAAVGSAVSGGTVISGPHPAAPNLNSTSAGTCSPDISIVGKPPKYVVPDTNSHSYTLAIKLVNGGANSISGATVAGSNVIPSAVIELYELKR